LWTDLGEAVAEGLHAGPGAALANQYLMVPSVPHAKTYRTPLKTMLLSAGKATTVTITRDDLTSPDAAAGSEGTSAGPDGIGQEAPA
jgi:hypothetical protein